MHARRTDGGGLNHVPDGKSLNCLVLGGASRAVRAADGLDVAAALLVTTAGSLLVLVRPWERSFMICILGCSLLDHDGLIL